MIKMDPNKKYQRKPVILLFRAEMPDDPEDKDIIFYMLNSFDGIRVFTWPDGIDGRVGNVEDIPIAESFHEAAEYVIEAAGKYRPIFLPFKLAKKQFKHLRWADMTLTGDLKP